jgi:hypothetical protein
MCSFQDAESPAVSQRQCRFGSNEFFQSRPAKGDFSVSSWRRRTCHKDALTHRRIGGRHGTSISIRRLRRSIRYGATQGDYEIFRQLLDEGGEERYRIKSVREPHERMVMESDLEPHSATR